MASDGTTRVQGVREPMRTRIEIYGVGSIPDPAEDALPQQWLDFAVVIAALHASDRSDVPVKEVARAYLTKWPVPQPESADG